MTRLIDADALTEVFKTKSSVSVCGTELCKAIVNRIDNAPTVDAVPVIRCKDCKHAEREDDGDIMCTFWDFCECNHHVLANGYCDRAERRKDDRRQNNTV